jgi:hypothetical protein
MAVAPMPSNAKVASSTAEATCITPASTKGCRAPRDRARATTSLCVSRRALSVTQTRPPFARLRASKRLSTTRARSWGGALQS